MFVCSCNILYLLGMYVYLYIMNIINNNNIYNDKIYDNHTINIKI